MIPIPAAWDEAKYQADLALINRVLAEGEVATCRHCGDIGRGLSDHTCPCPYSDADCRDHQGVTR